MQTKNVVTIGGGTGSFMLLTGLKKYPINISAIVSMADDGGSTGVLRDELGVLPPGDVRQCLVALSESSDMLRELMSYRFEGGGLKGHSFGNLLLSALQKINGSFNAGVKEASKILNVKGEVVPVTGHDAHLYIKLKNEKILKGEDEINHAFDIEQEGIKKIYFSPKVKANPKAIDCIMSANLVAIGPGNFYCSILPNLIVPEIAKALKETKAKIVFNCNLVNKKGHTEKFTLDDYVDVVERYIGRGKVDFVTFNTKKPSQKLVSKYENKKELLVAFKKDIKKDRHCRIVQADVLSNVCPQYSKSDVLASKRAFIRHDADKLAKILMMIMELGEYENIIKEII
ncbi:MAG: uridine diphosphate-N-acetylglucosamine-binding protein YvcK [Candidatus Pacebacteria bacterium]|nr:uridine diphosphate-N-acetylglucosamine-binding protein YvcK [Candidatus Paceibacterota bacterium]MDR3583052.1 uridine diphosphate-N-acetylglucosamine-binding protein YvcK [Candidatus Paceibacterota bacterium]